MVFSKGQYLGALFDPLSLRQQSELVRMTFSRADTWATSWGSGKLDTPLSALREVSAIGVIGMGALLKAIVLQTRDRLAAKSAHSKPLDPLMDKS